MGEAQVLGALHELLRGLDAAELLVRVGRRKREGLAQLRKSGLPIDIEAQGQ